MQRPFFQTLVKRAAGEPKHIVLPESEDERLIRAVKTITENKIAHLTMLGDVGQTTASLEKADVKTEQVSIIDPASSDKLDYYADTLYQLRKHKGLTPESARRMLDDPLYFGTMMVKCDNADGLVAGASHSTGDTIRPALQIIKAAPGIETVSSVFFVCKDSQVYLFADCGVVMDPDTKQLVDIIVSTTATAFQFKLTPRIAVLSYSTKSSHPKGDSKKAADAAALAEKKLTEHFDEDVVIDGEVQFDAAFVPDVAARKCPDSPLAGRANVFVFPNLPAGNITYKAVQRFAGADAYGPILQGLAKPVNDLSRGCNAGDVVATVAITVIQAQTTTKAHPA